MALNCFLQFLLRRFYMYWDKVSGVYDFFESCINGRVYKALGKRTAEYISENDIVLECACGTGAITAVVARKCRRLVAVDISAAMMKKAKEKCRGLSNVRFRKADMTRLNCGDEKFDKVIAGNVIHLLDDASAAVNEMLRVCKTGGKVIIPTYINDSQRSSKILAKLVDLTGLEFKYEFTLDSYKSFFFDMGLRNTEFFVIAGHMPCAVAVITKLSLDNDE